MTKGKLHIQSPLNGSNIQDLKRVIIVIVTHWSKCWLLNSKFAFLCCAAFCNEIDCSVASTVCEGDSTIINPTIAPECLELFDKFGVRTCEFKQMTCSAALIRIHEVLLTTVFVPAVN